MVQWDLGGEPLPYPTGVLNRFYLAVDPGASSPEAEEKSSALANESLSLSLMDADDEPSSSPMPSPGMALLSPSTVASGRKRRCDSEAGGSASPTKKPAAASKGKGKGKGKGKDSASAHDAQEKAAAGEGDVAPAVSAQDIEVEEEEDEADTPDSISLLIDGKWQKVALAPASADSALSRGEARGRGRGSTQGAPSDEVVAGGEAGGPDDDELGEEAVSKDAGTFSEFLERALSSGIYLSSLAEFTRLRCYMERDFDVDARFFDRAAGQLEAQQLVQYMRRHIDAALTATQPSAEDEQERERREREKAFADEMEEEEEEEEESDDGAGPSRRRGAAKKAGRGSKGSKKGRASATGAKGKGAGGGFVIDKETASAAVDAISVLLMAGCSSELQQQVTLLPCPPPPLLILHFCPLSPTIYPPVCVPPASGLFDPRRPSHTGSRCWVRASVAVSRARKTATAVTHWPLEA